MGLFYGMHPDDAEKLASRLDERLGEGWMIQIDRNKLYRDRIKHTVKVVAHKFDESQFEIGQSIPSPLIETVAEFEVHFKIFHTNPSEGIKETLYVELDDGNMIKMDLPEEEQERREHINKFKEHFSKISPRTMSISKLLAGHFDEVEEAILADSEELQKIDGIGEKRSQRIRNRHSNTVRQSLEDCDVEGLILIPDTDGTLRLPEEFDDGDVEPSVPTIQ